jgi:hypothetical protein
MIRPLLVLPAPPIKRREKFLHRGGAIRTAIDEILGPWKQQLHAGAALRDEDFDRLRYQALEEKSLGRQ